MFSSEEGGAETTVNLAPLTTIGVGGPAKRLIRAETEGDIIAALRELDDAGEPVLVLGGGSNVVISDAGFDGTVLQIATAGYRISAGGDVASVDVQAGQPWDELVQETVADGHSGLEALSGVPGCTGATPVQNVGAYGAEVAQTITTVRVWDRQEQAVQTLTNEELAFGYRDSELKRTTQHGSPRYVVLAVRFHLPSGPMSAPVRYAELARALGIEVGDRASAPHVRQAVLALRASKAMVLDPADRDTYSTGSFFTNPIVSASVADALDENAPRFPAAAGVKLSAAWLITHSGFDRGFGGHLTGGRCTLSTKHSLAVTNRGGARAEDVLTVARTVRDGVEREFGITLQAEPILVGNTL